MSKTLDVVPKCLRDGHMFVFAIEGKAIVFGSANYGLIVISNSIYLSWTESVVPDLQDQQ